MSTIFFPRPREHGHSPEWLGGSGLWLLTSILLFAPAFMPAAAAGEVVRVVKVFDGDTILLEDGRKVRYLGINTPEYQEPFYLKAKRLNESLVLGKEVRLEFDAERADGHDRLLAYVYVGDQFVNAKLVEAGLAHAFFIGPGRKHNTLLLQLQAEAKQRKVGMWSARADTKALKITTVHLADPAQADPRAPYVRVANLGDGAVPLAGYVLSNERGQRFQFPDVTVEPGYTIIVASQAEARGGEQARQGIVYWPTQETVWDPREDTAFLMDPSGALVDKFHYKGKRVTKSSR